MLTFEKKSAYEKWYQKNKQRLSDKRKKQYAENAEYRQRALEASRRYRSGERTPRVPANAPISLAQAAERLDVGASTLREWRRMKYFPEPKHHNRALWFTEKQVSLLKSLRDFFQKYRMRHPKVKEQRLREVRAFICANWN